MLNNILLQREKKPNFKERKSQPEQTTHIFWGLHMYTVRTFLSIGENEIQCKKKESPIY